MLKRHARVRVLGPITVDGSAASPEPRLRRLLAALVVAAPGIASESSLIEALWAESDVLPANPTRSLQTYVSRLRGRLGVDAIERQAPGYRLVDAEVDVDAVEFEAALGEANQAGQSGDEVQLIAGLRTALGLWQGDALGEFANEPWAAGEAHRLEELRAGARERLAELVIQSGQIDAALVADLERWAMTETHREAPTRLLMQALHHTGRQADALAAYRRLRDTLVTDLGLDPSDGLRRLEEQILLDDRGGESIGLLRGYDVEEVLGYGAFSVVFRGRQHSVDRDVAIKRVRAELANRPTFIRRFEAEARLVARLEHPHIVPLYDFWREPDSAFLVMRLMRGGNLEEALAASPWEPDQCLAVLDQVGNALTAAHSAGIVHLDVKPANVLLDEHGNAYLSDFGVALAAGDSQDDLPATSRAYISPELLGGEPAGPASDLFAFATMARSMLTGVGPARGEVAPLSAVLSSAVSDVLTQATAARPEHRLGSVEDFLQALRNALASGPSTLSHDVQALRNPYKGLRAFDEADASDFAGRDALVTQLVDAVGLLPLVAVVGPSGSGKSSVVGAGVVPALRRGDLPGSDHWFITSMLPGPSPFEDLAAALVRVATKRPDDLMTLLSDETGVAAAVKRCVPEPGATLLLVIDQFEELFTHADRAEIRRFLEALARAVSELRGRFRVLLTLRADFYDWPLRHERFGRLVRDGTVAVLPLAPDELELAIVSPARGVGADFEDGLLTRIVTDVTDQPGELPLLQFALTELFERRDANVMTLEAYDRAGAVAGALSRRAEELYQGMPSGEQAAARRLFSRLVWLDLDGSSSRRRTRRNELSEDPMTEGVVEVYGRARLLSFDRDPSTREPLVEIAHDALLEGWPRLRALLVEDYEELRSMQHLRSSAEEWESGGHQDADLYRGGRLAGAEDLMGSQSGELTSGERAFFEASLALRARQRDVELRATRRLRRLLAVVALLAVASLVAGILAVDRQRRADDRAIEAREQADAAAASALLAREAEQEADVERLVALAGTGATVNARGAKAGPTVAILLALEAHALAPSAATLEALHRALTSTVGNDQGTLGTEPMGSEITLLDDGRRIVLHSLTNIEIWDVEDRALVVSVEIPGSENSSRYDIHTHASGDGRLVAVATPELFAVIEIATGDSVLEVRTRTPALAVAISPDARRVAVGLEDGRVEVWEVADSAIAPESVTRRPAAVASLGWHPDGRLLAVGAAGPDLAVWSPGGDETLWELAEQATRAGPFYETPRLLFSAAGDRLVASMVFGEGAGIATTVRVLDPTSGLELGEPIALLGRYFVESLSWIDADEVTVVAAGAGRSLETIDLLAGTQRVLSTNQPVGAAVGLPDLGVVVSDRGAGLDVEALERSNPLVEFVPFTDEEQTLVGAGSTQGGAFVVTWLGPDGRELGIGITPPGLAAPPRIVDLTRPDRPSQAYTVPDGPAPFVVYGFGPVHLAVGLDGYLVRDAVDHRALGPLVPVSRAAVYLPQVSPRGDRMVIVDDEGVITLLDVASASAVAALGVFAEHGPNFVPASFSPEGDRVAVSGATGGVAVFDATTGELIVASNQAGMYSLGPDEAPVAWAEPSGAIWLLDPESLEVVGGPLLGHDGTVWTFQWSADGRRLASSGEDHTVRFWDLDSMAQIGRAVSAPGGLWGISADGEKMFVGALDGVEIWDFDPASWVSGACETVGRNLTPEEWDAFGPRTIERRATCPQYPL